MSPSLSFNVYLRPDAENPHDCITLLYAPTSPSTDEVARLFAEANSLDFGVDVVGVKDRRAAAAYVFDNLGKVDTTLIFTQNFDTWTGNQTGYGVCSVLCVAAAASLRDSRISLAPPPHSLSLSPSLVVACRYDLWFNASLPGAYAGISQNRAYEDNGIHGHYAAVQREIDAAIMTQLARVNGADDEAVVSHKHAPSIPNTRARQ